MDNKQKHRPWRSRSYRVHVAEQVRWLWHSYLYLVHNMFESLEHVSRSQQQVVKLNLQNLNCFCIQQERVLSAVVCYPQERVWTHLLALIWCQSCLSRQMNGFSLWTFRFRRGSTTHLAAPEGLKCWLWSRMKKASLIYQKSLDVLLHMSLFATFLAC